MNAILLTSADGQNYCRVALYENMTSNEALRRANEAVAKARKKEDYIFIDVREELEKQGFIVPILDLGPQWDE